MANVNLSEALTNLASSFDQIKKLIVAISYVSGLYMLVRGLALYKALGQSIGGHGQKGELAGPLVWIVVGTMLIYLPDTLVMSTQTIFGKSEINTVMSFSGTSGVQKQVADVMNILYKYFDLIGLISFVRGWFILSKMGHSGSQPGSIAKGITHIVGGVLLINIIDFFNIISNTLGFK